MMKELKALEETVMELSDRVAALEKMIKEMPAGNLLQRRNIINEKVIIMEDADKLKQVEDVLETWNSSVHKWRSSHAMVKINAIFAPAPKEK